MRRVFFSIILSIIGAAFGGLLLSGDDLAGLSLLSAVAFGLIINLNFFYIRRWDGCIEKLGGFVFALFTLLAATVPLILLQNHLPTSHQPIIDRLILILTVQSAAIGLISTIFLRTSNFKPLKPGEPLKW